MKRRPRLSATQERSRYYNHSTYNDLVITGLAGLRPRNDDTLEVNPLVPDGTWKYFCLDNIPYHGRNVSIIWDEDGSRYHLGKGMRVLVDGKEVGHSPVLTHLVMKDALKK